MKIVAFGDSITEGVIGVTPEQNWLRILGRKLGPGYELVNAGVGGNSAREAMLRYESDVLSQKPDAVIIEFGGNNRDMVNTDRQVDDAEFMEHLKHFREKLPDGCRVIMVTFPPIIDEFHTSAKLFPNGKLDCRLDSQRQIVREFAAASRWPLLDLYRLMWKNRYRLILPDGVHLNPEGQAFFAEQTYNLMNRKGWVEK